MNIPSPRPSDQSFVSKFKRKDALFLFCAVIITALIIVIQFSDEGLICSFRRQLTIVLEFIPVVLMILIFQINQRMHGRIKKIERQLTFSDQKLREIFSGTNNAMFLHDAHTGKILEVNNIMCEIYGYSLQEALNLSIDDFSENTPPYDQENAIAHIRRAVEKGPQLFLWRCKRKDGTLFWAEVHLRHSIIAGKSIVIAAVRDITDHIKAKDALKEERDFSDTIIESLPAIFYMYDMEGRLIRYNRNYQIISGFYVEDIKKHKMLNMVINEDKKRLQAATQKVLTDGEAVVTGRIITSDGRMVSMLYSAKKIVMQNHIYILGMGIDISKQVQVEEELQVLNQKLHAGNLELLASQQQLQASNEELTANRALLKSIMDSTDDLSWTVDAVEFKLLSYNKSVERHYQGSPYQLSIGISYKEIFNEEYSRIWLRIFQQTLREGFVSEEYQSLLHNKKIWIRTHLILRDNKPFAISIFARDITEQKCAEAEREKMVRELEAKNMELERFTYTVSHDLKAPLITIQGFLGYLVKSARNGNIAQLESDVTRISAAAVKMEKLLKDLLELSRVGRVVNPPERFPMLDAVKEAFRNVEGLVGNKNVKITYDNSMPEVSADKMRIVEVWQNLAENSIKYMGDQKEPALHAGFLRTDTAEIFFLRDNGIGIEPKYQQQIFGLFDKIDPKSEGTGVGLAIVKRIIEIHGGTIWVESQPGTGSTFFFTI